MQVVTEAVLWKYHLLRNGGYTVKVRITNYRNVDYITTTLSCKEEDWDEVKAYPKMSHRGYKELTRKIDDIIEEVRFLVKLAEKNGEVLTMAEIKKRVEKKKHDQVPVQAVKLFSLYDEIIDNLEKIGNIGYADVFIANKSIIYQILDGKDKPFTAYTSEDFKKIERHISSLNSESTKSLYLRTFYRVWNIAIKQKHCPEKHHPKFFIKFQPYKRIKTRKRAIPLDYIHAIENLSFDYSSRLFRSQQYFIFCFYSRGMNFTDFALLKKEINVRKGHLKYKRAKNKREYDFKLHPKAQKVVDIFENYPMKSDAGYVFPILDSSYNTPRKIDTRIVTTLKDFNDDLEEFEKMIDAPKHITSYVIRHSFATGLKKQKVDITVIKDAMGHETEEQTNVYLEETDDSIIADEIEKALI